MAPTQTEETGRDALSLLRADHAKVVELFEQFEQMKDDVDEQEKDALVARICGELIVHTAIEEELFYPEAREAMDAEDLFDEATVEHASAKDLIAQLGEMEPDDELYDAKVKVLGEYVKHHVQEEENEMFPQVQSMQEELDELGQEMTARKVELMEEMGMMDEEGAQAAMQGRSGSRSGAQQQRGA